MEFNQENQVVQLCTKGMELEGQGELTEAAAFFDKAWNIAATDFEKFTAAHYVARHQISVSDKLQWDKTAMQYALNINDTTINAVLPSLYLNIAKSYEELKDFDQAKNNYQLALSFSAFLREDGYGNTIKKGIAQGFKRIA